MAGSLTDGRGYDSIGTKSKKPAGGGNNGAKLAIAIVLLVIAGVVFAWYSGLFETATAKAPPALTAEQQAEMQKMQAKTAELEKQGKVIRGGAE
ncbi:MAG: hypothetical protein JNM80_06940 [Phycisphaerae bacterium]|nr:hypothetical protein [Phycisphaerae bacterium]